MIRQNLAAALLISVGVLGACADPADEAEGASSEATPSQPSAPECAEVWRADADLPTDYDGCLEDGELVEPDQRLCSSGQELVRYSTTHYAVRGGPIKQVDDLATDRRYQRILRNCTG